MPRAIEGLSRPSNYGNPVRILFEGVSNADLIKAFIECHQDQKTEEYPCNR